MSVTTSQLVAAGVVLVALFVLWLTVVRKARAAREAARSSVRLLSLAGRVFFTAALIVAVQWVVITHPGRNFWTVVAALGLPALLAAFVLVRALTVTALDDRRGGRR
ncbi:hypothetical protein [Allokutzneria sp. A3M-2-11 16]|uniref:hypothetical protein n=1 Tax=Allokutzneria sp. A3M-2-11 16 TaxID=2962043 RepID=UPI00211394E9|nr:hypothetical protein [Allokutzneria sp. A3M-2-11 16]